MAKISKRFSQIGESQTVALNSVMAQMKREGKDGKPVYVYKLRTMHPYSEYIQDFVYNHNRLQKGGKFNKDFRVTKWGAVFRKAWIDELPMFVNLVKGDVKLVGVRPISKQYLSLYDEEYRKRRIKYKPGLVPPYYAHLPNGLEEIIESEKKYLDEFDKNRPDKIVYSYFKNDPWIENTGMDYIGNTQYKSKTFTSYSHTLSDVVNSMVQNQIIILKINEYNHSLYEFKSLNQGKIPLSMLIVGKNDAT